MTNSSPIIKGTSLKDYIRWYGNAKTNYSEYVNTGVEIPFYNKGTETEAIEVCNGQLNEGRIVREDGTLEAYKVKVAWKNPFKLTKSS